MGRVINPDYFKVGAGTAGSGVSQLGRFDDDKAMLGATLARLHREAPHRDIDVAVARKERAKTRVASKPAAPRKAPRPAPPAPPAVVSLFRTDHPIHGRKRRSSKRKHDVVVLREYRERTEGSAPEAFPNALPAGRDWVDTARGLVSFAWEVALTPLTLARLLSRLRRERGT